MKAFDLKKALNGARLVTRDGKEVTDLKIRESGDNLNGDINDFPFSAKAYNIERAYTENGRFHLCRLNSNSDLFLADDEDEDLNEDKENNESNENENKQQDNKIMNEMETKQEEMTAIKKIDFIKTIYNSRGLEAPKMEKYGPNTVKVQLEGDEIFEHIKVPTLLMAIASTLDQFISIKMTATGTYLIF